MAAKKKRTTKASKKKGAKRKPPNPLHAKISVSKGDRLQHGFVFHVYVTGSAGKKTELGTIQAPSETRARELACTYVRRACG